MRGNFENQRQCLLHALVLVSQTTDSDILLGAFLIFGIQNADYLVAMPVEH